MADLRKALEDMPDDAEVDLDGRDWCGHIDNADRMQWYGDLAGGSWVGHRSVTLLAGEDCAECDG